MSKTKEYATNGAWIGGFGFLLFNVFKQQSRINSNPDLKFNWGELLSESAKGTFIGAGTGAIFGGVKDWNNTREKPVNTNAFLTGVVKKVKLDKRSSAYQKLSVKVEKISRFIKHKFKGKLGGQLVRMGSTEDNTALSESFDIDLSVPFSSKSYPSTSVMFHEVLYCLKTHFHDTQLIKIRAQRKSIGLLFEIDGEEFKIDVVPYKLSRKGQKNPDGYLFVNNNSLFKQDSYTKTNISSLRNVKLNIEQQNLLVALKNWKQNHFVPISSHLLKLLILDAYDNNQKGIPDGFTKRIIMVINHIAECIGDKRITSVENTNNVLTDISHSDKEAIKWKCGRILKDYSYQPNSILKYF